MNEVGVIAGISPPERTSRARYRCTGVSLCAETHDYVLQPVGVVRSSLLRREDAPAQGYEGAPGRLAADRATLLRLLGGMRRGQEILVLTWLHKAPAGQAEGPSTRNRQNPLLGVFATRSPDRPNPIGLHRVTVLSATLGASCESVRSRRLTARRLSTSNQCWSTRPPSSPPTERRSRNPAPRQHRLRPLLSAASSCMCAANHGVRAPSSCR